MTKFKPVKYVIQSNIPVPPKYKLRPESFQGKIRALKVGQSVFNPQGDRGATVYPKGRKYTSRSMNGGVRIWRLK